MHCHVLNERQELVENPGETGDVLRLGLTACRSADSPLLRSLAPSWLPTTAPPNSNAAWASSSPD
jgi:hypothetical protein